MPTLIHTIPLLTSTDTAGRTAASANSGGVDIVALTTGLTAGNEESFRQFHALYFDRLLRYHIVLARGDEESAHDALQETFLRVVRNARRFDEETVFWSWLTVLCRSAAVDGGRKRNRYWKLIADYARSLIAPATAPRVTDDGNELYDVLTEVLCELDATERALIEGKYLRRLSVRELAAECGLTEKAIESRLVRARETLRRKIETKLKHERAS